MARRRAGGRFIEEGLTTAGALNEVPATSPEWEMLVDELGRGAKGGVVG